MRNLKQLLLVMAIALTGFTPAQAQYTHYSEWMANSRNYKVYKSGSYRTFSSSTGNSGDFWRYDDGLMYEAILDTYHRYETNTSLLEGVRDYLKWCFQGSSSPYIGNLETTTLDDMRPGRLVWKYKRTYSHSDTDYDSKYEAALSALMQTSAFANSSRVTINGSTGKGYPWQHKSNLGGQVWLDGIFMGLPFWTLAGPVIGSGRDEYSSWTTSDFFQDAVSQILKTDEKTYGDELGLWAHAWDGEGDEAWSTKNSSFTTGSNVPPHADVEEYAHDGRSSHCWGRALGWYAMAIMETMDNIQLQNGSGTYNTQINTLKPIFKKVMDKVIETRDPSSGVWYCVLDVGDNSSATSPYYGKGPKKNYLEATCSSMFAYCLLHGVAQGYLDTSYTTVAQDVYNSVVTQFIRNDSSNKKKLIRCDQVAGLGGTSTVDKVTYNRDGSFAYYMLEDSIDNDSKGVGPFIWASLAAETTPYNYTIATGFPSIASDGIVQFRWSRVADDFTVQGTTPTSFVSPTFTAKTSGGTTLTNSTDITFVSDNTKVATVDDNGTISLAGEAGTANITATRTGGSYAGAAIYTVTTTGTDTTKPTLSSSTPTTDATDVAVSGNITLTFSENVTINDATKITLTGGSGTLVKENATTDGATITIPYSGLANSTTYTLNIAADAVKDLSENTNDALENITFTTIAADETAPTLSSQSIANNAPNVSTSGTIVLTFSEDVACTTNATLTPAGGSAINLTPSVSGSTVTYSYSGLSNSTSYTFNLADNSVTDLAGNNYASAVNFSFTTRDASAGKTWDFETTWNFDDTEIKASSEWDNSNAGNVSTLNSVEATVEGTKIDVTKGIFLTTSSNDQIRLKSGQYISLRSNSGTFTIKNVESGNTITITACGASKDSGITATTSNVSQTSGTASQTKTDFIFNVTATGDCTFKRSENTETRVYKIVVSGSTPSTFTLTNQVNTSGYGTVSPASVSNILSGTAVTAGTGDNINKYTVGETTVTATPTEATAEYNYAFSGWSNLPSTVTTNTTVTANFTRTAKSYDLAWNSNGGDALTGTYTSGSTAFGTTLTTPNNPTRSGYTFTGWNTASDGSGSSYTGTMPAATTTYYAQWVAEGAETSETVTPTGIDSSTKNLTFSTETNLVVNLPNGSMEYDEAKFKGDAAIDISSVGSKYIKEIVITYDATSERHPDAANDLTIKNVTSNGSVVTSGSVLGSVTSTTSSPYTTTWSDNSGAKNINKVTLNYANNSHSLYISNIKVTYWGASETPTVEAPTFTAHPANATYTQGDTPTALSVTATGNPAPTYQWYKNTDNDKTAKVADQIEGATAATLPVANISTATAGTFYYYCVATNSKGTATSNSATITVNAAGGSGSGTVLFSQNFDDATEVAYAASTAQAITSGNNIVGKDVPSTKFTSITCNKKDDTGIGINSTTGGNSKDYTGKFGAFYDNTSGYWSIVKTTSFASTTPTAIKVEMNAAFSPVSSGSNIGVQFAVGSEFTDGLTNTCPALSNCVAGFALPSNNTIRVAKYSTSNANTAINSSSATLTNGTSYKYTWVINNTDETLTYKGADNNNTTVAAGCWDLWIGTSRNLAGISQSTTGMSGTSLQNLYIGSPFGKKHEFIMDDIKVYDLTPTEVAKVATPEITPADGTVFEGTTQNVSISCSTSGASIYYTLDGTEPTTSSIPYNSAFTIYGTKTVKAIAIKEGMTNSIMAAATITNTCLNEYTDGTLLLKQNATEYTPVAASGVTVTLERSLQANKWNPMCLPFDITPSMFSQTTQIETLQKVSNGVFTFAPTNSVPAGTPFIAKPAANIANPVFEDVEVKTVDAGSDIKDGYTFQGNYTKVTLDPETNLFISMSQQKLVSPTGSNILQGLRGYFIVPSGEGARFSLNFDGEMIVTDINRMNIEHLPFAIDDNTPIYNLSGQRVSKDYKGIVIINGKKFVRK